LNDGLQGCHRSIKLAFVVVSSRQFLLQLVEIRLRSLQPGTIAIKRERAGGRVIEIFADSLEQQGASAIASERTIAVLVIRVQVLAASTLLASVTLVRTAAWEATIAWVRTVALIRAVTLIAAVVACPLTAILTRLTVVPGQSKRILTGTALRVFDPDYGGAAISRRESEILMATSAHRRELEVCRICRHCRCTFKTSPLWSSATEVPKHAIRAQNVHLNVSVDGNR